MKKLLLSAVTLLMNLSFASIDTDKDWNKFLKQNGLESENQAYCYTNEADAIEGKNIDLKIRLASVSKLLTSLWSIDKLKVDHTFDTKLFIKNNVLHIKGSFDPFLSNEKMFFLLSELNRLGYNSFDLITFDKNLMIFPDAPYLIDSHPDMSRAVHVKRLMRYFNTLNWGNDFKEEYSFYKSLSKSGMYRDSVQFQAGTAQFVESSELENDPEAKTLTLSSPPLYKYLKEVNVKSNNYVSETLFRMLGNTKAFDQFLLERFNLDRSTIHLYTGSGLPYINENGERFDNYATCSIMMKVIFELKNTVEEQNKEIEDIMAVPGNDKGTFRNRIFPADYKNSFVAKTGTLKHTSTLAGAMNTQKGFSFFGIFNQSTDIVSSKKVQNEMVKSIMTELGGPKHFEYTVEPFHTYSGDLLKSILDSTDRFSPIDGGLK